MLQLLWTWHELEEGFDFASKITTRFTGFKLAEKTLQSRTNVTDGVSLCEFFVWHVAAEPLLSFLAKLRDGVSTARCVRWSGTTSVWLDNFSSTLSSTWQCHLCVSMAKRTKCEKKNECQVWEFLIRTVTSGFNCMMTYLSHHRVVGTFPHRHGRPSCYRHHAFWASDES